MRVLVPLPFDISNLAHGRNLRIAHLLPALRRQCELLCITSEESVAAAARRVMPKVDVQATDSPPDTQVDELHFKAESFLVRRSLSFLGYDARLVDATWRLAASADVVLGFDMPSVACLKAAAAVRGSGRQPRIVCDLIDDPWLMRKSLPRNLRWSASSLKSALAIQVVRRRVLSRFDALTAVSPQDAASLSRATGRPTAVVPNGAEVDPTGADNTPREPLVVFTGSMNFPPNIAAARFMARQVWPLVLASRRCGLGSICSAGISVQPTLAIVGANPAPAVQALAGLPNVIVTGRVPSIGEWLGRACVAVAPMLGGTGIKNKILEACAAGCPVVATSAAVGGLPTGQDAGIIIADGPERIAAEVFRLLVDGRAARRIGSAGRETVRTRFSWTRIAEAFLEVLRGHAALPAGEDEPDFTQTMTGKRQDAEDKEVPAYAAS